MENEEPMLPEKTGLKVNRKNVLKWLGILLAVIVAAASIRYASFLASPSRCYYKGALEQFNTSRDNVMELVAASTATSTVITLMHDDWGSPVAEKLADLSTGFLIVLAAIFVEKYLLTTILYVSLLVGVPAVCLAFITCIWFSFRSDGRRTAKFGKFAKKLLVFLIALNLCIPCSVGVSGLIRDTYKESIEDTIANAAGVAQEIEEVDSEEESEDEEEQGFFGGLISKVSGVAEDITSSATAVVEKAKSCLNDFIEALAVLIVTSCVIPLVVIWVIWALVKRFWEIDIVSAPVQEYKKIEQQVTQKKQSRRASEIPENETEIPENRIEAGGTGCSDQSDEKKE